MEWTTDKPTESGWYWIWDNKKPCMVLISPEPLVGGGTRMLGFVIDGCWFELNEYTYYMGPIPQPEPPTISADQTQKTNV